MTRCHSKMWKKVRRIEPLVYFKWTFFNVNFLDKINKLVVSWMMIWFIIRDFRISVYNCNINKNYSVYLDNLLSVFLF